MTHFIEDILHLLVDSVGVNDSDKPIMKSISQQIKKGVALTDRQYDLMLNKISLYKDQLYDYDVIINGEIPTRLPLRIIDRSKTISIVSHADMVGNNPHETYKQNWLWVRVRFPFSKKLIAKLDSIKTVGSTSSKYHHVKGTHEHFFRLNGSTVVKIVDAFKHSNFEIDSSVMEYYYKSAEIIDNKDFYVPQLKNNQLLNFSDEVINLIGKQHNKLTYVDRRLRFGYKTDVEETDDLLASQVAFRKSQIVHVNPEQYTLADISTVLEQLNRFPLLVMIDNSDSYEQLCSFHKQFNFVDDNLQSVLFRVDSDDSKNLQLNQYVKDHKLNNWVDNKTKIVYIKKTQLPKVLLNSNFKPMTAIATTSYRSNSHVDVYCKFYCDLIIYHDKEQSYFGAKFGSYTYG